MKKIYLLLLVGLVFSCKQQQKQHNEVGVIAPAKPEISQEENKNWYDSLVKYYISKSDHENIQAQRKFKDKLDWELDRKEDPDSSSYFMVKIGHHETEEDGSNMRFTADAWICIDSISQNIYEYDLPNDKLVLWKNN